MSEFEYYIASSSCTTRHPGAGDQQYATYDAFAFVDVDCSPDAFVGYSDSHAGPLEYTTDYTDPIPPNDTYYPPTPSTEVSTPDLYYSSGPDTPYTPSPTDSAYVPTFISPPSALNEKAKKSPKQPRKRSKKDPGHVPRPSNAFILYRSEYAKNHRGECKQDVLSVVVGRLWRAMPAKEKARYEAMADIEKKLHECRHPGYVFAPKAKSETKAPAASQVTGHGSTAMKKDRRPNAVPQRNPTTFLERTPVPDDPAFSSDAFVPLRFPLEAGIEDYVLDSYVQTPFSALAPIAPSYAYNPYSQGYSTGHQAPGPSFPVTTNTNNYDAPAFPNTPFSNFVPLNDEPYCYDPSLTLPPYNPSGFADAYIAPFSDLYATDPQSEFAYSAYGNSYYSG